MGSTYPEEEGQSLTAGWSTQWGGLLTEGLRVQGQTWIDRGMNQENQNGN